MSEQSVLRVELAEATAPATHQKEYRSGIHAKRRDAAGGWGLVMVSVNHPPQVVGLNDGAVVGSAERESLMAIPGIAPEHARVNVRSDGCYIEDLGTQEGTWVNGVRARRINVMHGDVVRLGEQIAVFVERELNLHEGIPGRLGPLVHGSKQHRDWIEPALDLVRRGSNLCIEGSPGVGKRTLAHQAAMLRQNLGDIFVIDGTVEGKPIATVYDPSTPGKAGTTPAPAGVRPVTWLIYSADRLPRPQQLEVAHAVGRMTGATLIITTDQPLDRAAGDGHIAPWFASLFSGKRLTVPSLELRREDILLIVRDIAERMGIALDRFTPDLLEALVRAGWPGGVPQLENVITTAAQATPEGPLALASIADQLSRGPRLKPNLPPATDPSLARARLEDALARANGSVASAARALGMSRQAIYREADRLGLDIARRKVR
ncbi:FHA domain-containing protein [Chondromyces crocatus]|uniref:Sigma-54 dependent transcriptional regulator n=1 Tax=Chondromyces crocatus TaxID=52 RepID=A0A0K1EGE3_CHOCO|nr:FHA domain-containing protein [Chondromyces crocatus]AKT39940.1 sigma-54 dependent transcriptional regulator [Chondromyces crocatus]